MPGFQCSERNEVKHSPGVKDSKKSFTGMSSFQLNQQGIISTSTGTYTIGEKQRHSRGYDLKYNALHTLTQDEYNLFQRTKRYTADNLCFSKGFCMQ